LYGKPFNERELFLIPPTWDSDIQMDFTRNANRLDNKSGFFRYDLKSINPTETRQIDYTMGTVSEINNMQRFFYRCRGKLHSFFAPTWLNDVDLVEEVPSGQNWIIAKYPYYWKYFSTGDRRKRLIVFYRDGSAEILRISAYTMDDSGQYSKIYLDGGASRTLNVDNVAMISYLCQYRHDNDTMTVSYESGEAGTTSFTLQEVSE
jgi:hypothetical protein